MSPDAQEPPTCEPCRMKIVVALGGKSLGGVGEPGNAQQRETNAIRAAYVLAQAAQHNELIVTHGRRDEFWIPHQPSAALDAALLNLNLRCASHDDLTRYLSERPTDGASDRDTVARHLATRLEADGLVLVTDIQAVGVDHGLRTRRDIHRTTPEHLRALRFDTESIGPKIEAACRFVESGGQWAAIGSIDQLVALVEGTAGTRVVPGPGPLTYHDMVTVSWTDSGSLERLTW